MDLKSTTRKLVATVALAGAVTAGTAGAAFAADGAASTSGDASAQTARHPRRAALRHAIGGIVTTTLGVERADLRSALKGGQSISEYAASLNQDPQLVVDALVSAANGRIDQAVANGRITEERGVEVKAKVPERVNTLVNRHVGQAQGS